MKSFAAIAVALSLASPALAQPAPVTSLGDGLVGTWFAPPTPDAPVVLALGGSEGGTQGAAGLAKALAREGFGALGLGYFGAPGLPQTLQLVPVEYFEKAADWLLAQPGMKGRKVLLIGGSKGGEAALLVAAHDPRICAVVAGAPSNVAWAGVNPANYLQVESSWSLGGKPVAYVPYDRTRPFTGVLDLYKRSLETAPADAVIPVEKIAGPVLFVSGKEDQLWPSSAMSDAAMARLDAAKFRYPHQHLAYANAGHAAFGAPMAPDNPNLKSLASLGGTVEGNQAARADAWPKTVAFLKRAAGSPGCRSRR